MVNCLPNVADHPDMLFVRQLAKHLDHGPCDILVLIDQNVLEAVDQLNRRFPGLDLILVESGGDNLSATFSPELSDLTIYVIDVSAGDKLPRKGGPGICKSDLLVINKIDLAPLVGASLELMNSDTTRMRNGKPFVFSNQKTGVGLEDIVAFIERQGLLTAA